MSKTFKHVLILSAAIIGLVAGVAKQSSAVSPGVVSMLGESVDGLPPASKAYSTSTTCRPYALWNPDAGIGQVRCGAGYSTVNVELTAAQTTAVKFVWRSRSQGANNTYVNTTRADLETYGMVRCAGCTNGAAYQAEVSNADQDLFCVTAADGGFVLAVECGK